MAVPNAMPPRIQIRDVWPQLDCGRHPVKRTLGGRVEVCADIFLEGHDELRAAVRYRAPSTQRWEEVAMRRLEGGGDRWTAAFDVTELGWWEFTIEAWTDPYASWLDEMDRKIAAGQENLSGELSEGRALFGHDGGRSVSETIETFRGEGEERGRSDRRGATTLARPLGVDVDRERATFGAWYELFPRSWGGFRGVERELPRFAELGFDVLYFPPIHPIGRTHRKGRNNAEQAAEGDPGSPWAIGSEEGGHTAVHPDLGTLEDLDRLVARASELGLEIALDFAVQCSPDHPWLREHPEWFHQRPDGTLKYAENPPKRYQDIYNVNFVSDDWQGLWEALRDVVLFWIGHGINVFRVDNPHTKPLPFWEWLIREVRAEHPDVVFLAEAFTRPAVMEALSRAGFNQSYTYFTWKNTKAELVEYMTQLSQSLREFFRPNFFANTPDILHAYLQQGGRPAFEARLVLAATLSPSYGIYSGFEHCENVPAEAGSEEYLDSEKYELKQRRLDGPLLPLVARLNAIRRENAAFKRVDNIAFLETGEDELIAYAKREPGNTVLVCVNLDADSRREGAVVVPDSLDLPRAFTAHDLLADQRYEWRTGANDVQLDPGSAHILRLEP
jgi:starch synthase (maltosyl-transferring)